MTALFRSPLSDSLRGFLQFKRSLGYRYQRAEHTLMATESSFVPYVLSEKDVRRLLDELRLRLRDIDTRAGVLFVEMFKGRSQ